MTFLRHALDGLPTVDLAQTELLLCQQHSTQLAIGIALSFGKEDVAVAAALVCATGDAEQDPLVYVGLDHCAPEEILGAVFAEDPGKQEANVDDISRYGIAATVRFR